MSDFSIRKLSSQFNPKKDFIAKDESGNLNIEKGGIRKRVSMIFLNKEQKQKYDLLSVVNRLNDVFQKKDLRQLSQAELKALGENLRTLKTRYLSRIRRSDSRRKEVEDKMNGLIKKVEDAYKDQFGGTLGEIEGEEEFTPLNRFERMKGEGFGKAFGMVWNKHMFEEIPESQHEFEEALKLKNPLEFETRIKQIASKYWVKRFEKDFPIFIIKQVVGADNYNRLMQGRAILDPYTIEHFFRLCEKKQEDLKRDNKKIIADLKKEYFHWIVDEAVDVSEKEGFKRISKEELRKKCDILLEEALGRSVKNEELLKLLEVYYSKTFIENFLKTLLKMKDSNELWAAVKQGKRALEETVFDKAFTLIKDQIVDEKAKTVGKKLSENDKILVVNKLFSIVDDFQPELATDIEQAINMKLKVKSRDEIFAKVRSLNIETIANNFIEAIEEYIKR